MIFASKTFGVALAVSLAGTVGAFASTIDLTDSATYTTKTTSSATGSTVEADWEITPIPDTSDLTYSAFDATATPGSPLAFEYDGVGITDDEVNYPSESLVMTFSTGVDVTGIYTLDLFGFETVSVYANGDALTGTLLGTFGGSQPAYPDVYGGYGYFAISSDTVVTSLTFVPGQGNDCGDTPDACQSKPDFALAGVDIAPIPLPAAGFLLLGGLGALGLAKRRRKV